MCVCEMDMGNGKKKRRQKSNRKYVYQLRTTQEIRTLENQFKMLREHALNNGWTNAYYREYTRIRDRETAKHNTQREKASHDNERQ